MLSASSPAWLLRERRVARVAGVAALASLLSTLAAVSVVPRRASPAGPTAQTSNRARDLLDFNTHETAHLLSASLRALSLLLILVVVVFLRSAAQRRDPRPRRLLLWAGLAGTLSLVVTTLVGYVALRHTAAEFAAGRPRSVARADDLVDGASVLRTVSLAEIAAHVVFGVWVLAASQDAMKAGLIPRGLGIWGVLAGVMVMILPVGDILLAGWLGSIGVLALGWWPGGRPPSWTSGIPGLAEDHPHLPPGERSPG